MEKLSIDIKEKNGKERIITVELEDELANWLLNQPLEVYRDFILFEYRARCTERKETRRIQSLERLLKNGFVLQSESNGDWRTVYSELDLKRALSLLTAEQQWLIRQIYCLGRSRVEIAREMGLTEGAVRSRLHTILRKIKKIIV